MIEELKRMLEEENIRHKKIVSEIEERIKKLEEEKKKEEDEQKVYFVPPKEENTETIDDLEVESSEGQKVYFVPSEEENTETIDNLEVESSDEQKVYFVPPEEENTETTGDLEVESSDEQKVYFVPSEEENTEITGDLDVESSDEQKVYFVPPKEENIETMHVEESSDDQNVYFPPEHRIKKQKSSGLFGFLRDFFGFGREETKQDDIPDSLEKNKEEQSDDTGIIYTVPKSSEVEQQSDDTGPIYMVPKNDEEEKEQQNEFSSVIEYAKGIKEDKEKHKNLQNKYLEAFKANNKDLVSEVKNMLWESQNKIALAESFLRNQIKEVRKSDLPFEEKTKLINYVCGIAKMKVNNKPKHLKENNGIMENEEEVIHKPKHMKEKTETMDAEENTVDELNKRKERINNSSHFSPKERAEMIRKIDDELIELSKNEENSKSL